MAEITPEHDKGQSLSGQQASTPFSLPLPFTEKVIQYAGEETLRLTGSEGGILNEITPIDAAAAKVRTVDLTAILAQFLSFPGEADLSGYLPKILLGLTAVWDDAGGNGTYAETATGASVGTSVSLALNTSGDGQGSASVVPALIPQWKEVWGVNLPVMDYFFALANPISAANIISRLALGGVAGAGAITANQWPVFKPNSPPFVLVGQKVSMNAKAAARCAVSINSTDVSETQSSGGGQGYDWSSNVAKEQYPLCLHGSISISGLTTKTKSATADATAVISSGTNFPGASGGGSASGTATGYISPTSLSATSPAAWPTYGLYILKRDLQPWLYGLSICRVRVFDFATVA